METVTAGIDKLHLTFDTIFTPEMLVSDLFDNVSLDQFQKVNNRLKGENKKKISWYGTSYYLKTTENTVLVAIHTDPISNYGKKNLVQIHGLTFSDSSLNALRPLNIKKLLAAAFELNASVSKIDLYIDDYTGSTPVNQIFEQSLPHNYRRFIRSPFVRDHKGEQTFPRPFPTSIYYGAKGGSACQVLFYQKNLSPLQKIYSPDNALKFPWVRFELRLKGSTAKNHGKNILDRAGASQYEFTSFEEPLPITRTNGKQHYKLSMVESPDRENLGPMVANLFRDYFNFIEPSKSRASLCPVQAWWLLLLEKASSYNNMF